MPENNNILARVWRLYADGFREMTIGRTLWAIIIVKLVVMFAVLKLFFFPDVLATQYDTDAQRAGAVREALASPQAIDQPNNQ